MLKENTKAETIVSIEGDKTQCSSDTSSQSSQDNKLVQSIAVALYQLISENKSCKMYKQKLKQQEKQIFTSKQIPKISLGDYLTRIVHYTKVEESTLVIALIYIDRICKRQKLFLNEYNIHRTILASIVVAIKFLEDKYYSNLYYGKVGGVRLDQMNALESEFIDCLDFSLYVDTKLYEKYERNLIAL